MNLLYVLIVLLLAIPTYGVSLVLGLLLFKQFSNIIMKRKFKAMMNEAVLVPNVLIVGKGLSGIYYNTLKEIIYRESLNDEWTKRFGSFQDYNDYFIISLTLKNEEMLFKWEKIGDHNVGVTYIN